MVFRVGQTPQETASGPGAERDTAFSAVSCVHALQDLLGQRLNDSQNRSLSSLSQEHDPELFAEAILQLGRAAGNSDNLEAASLLYHWLQSGEAPRVLSVQARARRELDAMEGRGDVGKRAEFLLRRFVREASDPAAIFAMGAAGALFRVTRLATIARLAATPETGILTRGFGARAVSALAGFGVEATAFPFLNRLGGEALGRSHPWELNQLRHEVASSFFTLGALKLCGWGSGAAFRRVHRLAPGLPASLSQQAFQQAGMLSGILIGHGMEELSGLRPHRDGATTMVDSLAMLLQFNVAGSLTRRAFGRNFHSWEQRMDFQHETLQRPSTLRPTASIFNAPALAVAMGPQGPGTENTVLMTAEGPRLGANAAPIIDKMGEAEVGESQASRPNVTFEYPPELDAELSRLEAQMRAPEYLEGSREELLARRPDADLVDRLWFHQLKDFLDRIPYARYAELDDSVFLSRMDGWESDPRGTLIDAARARLGSRARPGSPSLKVIEIRVSRPKLKESLDYEASSPDGALSQLGGILELQNALKDGLQFLDPIQRDGDRIFRIPAPSYAEALLQNAFGPENIQFHYVDGAIGRDQVMSLRSRRVAPIGFSRGMVWFKDVESWTYPSPFSAHDEVFHGSFDAQAEPGAYEQAQRFYDWLKSYGAEHAAADKLMDRLADGEMRRVDFSSDTVGINLRLLLVGSFERMAGEADLSGSRAAVDLAHLLERVRPSWVDRIQSERELESHPEPNAWEILFQHVRSAIRPRIAYPPNIEAAWQKIERSFAQPDYYEGNRRELGRRRPDRDAVDAVWLHQAAHFIDVQAKISGEFRDAEAILELNPPEKYPQAASLLREALDLLGERGGLGSPARQVLVFQLNDRSETEDVWRWKSYSLAMPVLNEASRFLKNQIQLETMLIGDGRGVVPSLSLLEALYQVAQGRPVQFHEVLGQIPRDTVMALRAKGVSPIGLSREILPLGHFNSDVHPFLFSGHDGLFHAGVLAQMPENYPRTAGLIYDWTRSRLPEGPIREGLLDLLADLNVSEPTAFGMKMFRKMMENTLRDGIHWIQNEYSPGNYRSRIEIAEQSLAGFRRMIEQDFNSQGGLVRTKRSFLDALKISERRVATLRSVHERFEALEIAASPIVYDGETLDAIAEIESRYQTPGYYEGTREELRAKRPPLDLADRLWFAQALDYAWRIPGSTVDIKDADVFLRPMHHETSIDAETIGIALRGLPSHPLARQVLEVSVPVETMCNLHDNADMSLRFLATTPSAEDFEVFVGRKVQIWGASDGRATFRIPSLSMMERMVQAVHGEDRSQFHFVLGVVPRDIVASLRSRRVSVVGLGGAPVYFSEFDFAGTNSAIHPWTFSMHDAFEHASMDAGVDPGIPEAANWLNIRIRESFPDSALREKTLDYLTTLRPASGESPFESLSHVLFRALVAAQSKVPGLPATLQKAAAQEARIFAESLKQLIDEEFVNYPSLHENRAHFEQRLESVDQLLSWSSTAERGENYLSRIEYSPADQANWDALMERFGRSDYLRADSASLARNRIPADLVNGHWFFQAEDFLRTIPGGSMALNDVDVFLQPSINRAASPDTDLVQRAINSAGRPDAGTLARQVLEMRIPVQVFEESLFGDRRHLALGLLLHVEDVLDKRILLAEPQGDHFLIRVPSLTFHEKLLQAAFGEDQANFHYVHGDISRDQSMALRSSRHSPVGFSRNKIFLGDLGRLTHGFNFTAHDAFFHGSRDARVSPAFANLSVQLYEYFNRRGTQDRLNDDFLTRLAEMEDQAIEGGDLNDTSRDAVYLLSRAYQQASGLEGTARSQEMNDLDRLSRGVHGWIRSQGPRAEALSESGRRSLATLMELRRALGAELRPDSRSGRRSR